jgi:hypothetical protein
MIMKENENFSIIKIYNILYENFLFFIYSPKLYESIQQLACVYGGFITQIHDDRNRSRQEGI